MSSLKKQITTGIQISVALSAMLLQDGCGKDKSKTTDATTPTATNSAASVAADSQTSTALVSTQLDDVVSSLNSGDSTNTATGAALTSTTITRDRSCAIGTNKDVTVTLTYSGEASQTVGKATMTETAGGTETRIWTNAGFTMACTTDAKFAKVAWNSPTAVNTAAGINGLTLNDTTKRSRAISTSYTNKKGTTLTRSATVAENGTRSVVWATPAGATTTATTTKTITSNVVKTNQVTKFDGSVVNLDATVATGTGAPLQVTVKRDVKGIPQSHTIHSGMVTVSKTGEFYVTNTFADVMYDLTATDPCTPISGTLTTNIYTSNSAADLTVPLKTLTITFASTGPTVTGDDTATDNLIGSINHSCDFKQGD
ncbi:MAG: hypothetical protein H7249_07190 [Chitinophagaceae bacterium]|nr:hypothetical protein [Oligoflexus sp.]